LEVFQGKLKNKVSFIISNPPYLASRSEVDNDVMNHEPHIALFAPENDPLYFYREIAEHADEFLEPGGMVFLECPHERIDAIDRLFGDGWKTHKYRDLTGRERVLTASYLARPALN
jgi:release factor glutamine methyltransferase